MTKEKGGQHDPEHVADNEEPLWVVAHRMQNIILEKERAKSQEVQSRKGLRHPRRDFTHEGLLILCRYSASHTTRDMNYELLHNTMVEGEVLLST